jgi:hypothetical protein
MGSNAVRAGQGRRESKTDAFANLGARFGSMRLDVRGMVRRAKTLEELDLDSETTQWSGYAVDDDEPLAVGFQWGLL